MSDSAYYEDAPTKAIGYVRASTAEQRESGLGLQAQRTAIESACAARGWELVRVEEDIASGAKADRRGLTRALEAVSIGDVDCIIVLRLDRRAGRLPTSHACSSASHVGSCVWISGSTHRCWRVR